MTLCHVGILHNLVHTCIHKLPDQATNNAFAHWSASCDSLHNQRHHAVPWATAVEAQAHLESQEDCHCSIGHCTAQDHLCCIHSSIKRQLHCSPGWHSYIFGVEGHTLQTIGSMPGSRYTIANSPTFWHLLSLEAQFACHCCHKHKHSSRLRSHWAVVDAWAHITWGLCKMPCIGYRRKPGAGICDWQMHHQSIASWSSRRLHDGAGCCSLPAQWGSER